MYMIGIPMHIHVAKLAIIAFKQLRSLIMWAPPYLVHDSIVIVKSHSHLPVQQLILDSRV